MSCVPVGVLSNHPSAIPLDMRSPAQCQALQDCCSCGFPNFSHFSLRNFQAVSGGFRRFQAVSGSFRQFQADSGGFTQVQAGSGCFRQFQAVSGSFRNFQGQFQAVSGSFRQLQAVSRQFQAGSGSCSHQFQPD